MDSTLLAGIIGGICTIAAGIVTPLAQTYSETRDWFPISRDRRKLLRGKWQGLVHQQVTAATDITFSVELDLSIQGKKIQGKGIINGDELNHVALNGAFRNDRFLKMDYRNSDPVIVQFGSFVFHLSDDSKELTGNFVGYGHLSKKIIHGTCGFSKKIGAFATKSVEGWHPLLP